MTSPYKMTVDELREALKGVPGDILVAIGIDTGHNGCVTADPNYVRAATVDQRDDPGKPVLFVLSRNVKYSRRGDRGVLLTAGEAEWDGVA